MPPIRTALALLVLCAVAPLPLARAHSATTLISPSPDTSVPGTRKWKIQYACSDAAKFKVQLSYKYWDTAQDGDVPSKKVLVVLTYPTASNKVGFTVSLSPKESAIVDPSGRSAHGAGFPLDATFAATDEPKPNADGFYILAQKPADPKNPAAIGDTGEASAWIELSIEPQ